MAEESTATSGDPSQPDRPTKAEKEAADRKAAEVRRGQKSKTVRDVQVDEAKAFKLTGSLAEQQKIHILTMPEPKALQHYGYTGYSDKQTYSSRVVRSMGLDEEEIPLDERINPRKLTDAQLRTELQPHPGSRNHDDHRRLSHARRDRHRRHRLL